MTLNKKSDLKIVIDIGISSLFRQWVTGKNVLQTTRPIFKLYVLMIFIEIITIFDVKIIW